MSPIEYRITPLDLLGHHYEVDLTIYKKEAELLVHELNFAVTQKKTIINN